MKNGISYKTIIKNQTLEGFVTAEEKAAKEKKKE
jgi:hypothetical protein